MSVGVLMLLGGATLFGAAFPKRDRRFRTGYKNNAVPSDGMMKAGGWVFAAGLAVAAIEPGSDPKPVQSPTAAATRPYTPPAPILHDAPAIAKAVSQTSLSNQGGEETPSPATPEKIILQEAISPKSYKQCLEDSAGITSEMYNCNNAEHLRLQEELKSHYSLAAGNLSPKEREAFALEEQTWRSDMENDCDAAGEEQAKGGTPETLISGGCKIDQLEKHLVSLRSKDHQTATSQP